MGIVGDLLSNHERTGVFNHKILANRSTLWSLTLVGILVVLVRGLIFIVDTTQADIAYDVDSWLTIARNVVNGRGYSLPLYRMSDELNPTAIRGPTVVYFFAAVLWLTGDHPWSILIAQWLVEVGTSIILFFIAMEIFKDRRVAFVTCLLFAFYEPGIIFTFRAWSEPVFTLVLAGFTLSLLYALRRPSTWRYGLCGFLLGLSVLARPVMQFYPLIVLALVWWALERRWGQIIPQFAVFFLAFAAAVSPWLVRNYVVFNAFIPGSTHRGAPFYEGNFALDQPDYLRHRGSEEANMALRKTLEARFGPGQDSVDSASYSEAIKETNPSGRYAKAKGFTELQMDQFAFQEGVKAVRANPGRYVILSLVRLFRVWFHHRFVTYVLVGGPLPRSWLVAAINGALVGLAVVAFLWFPGPRWQPPVVSLIVVVTYNSAVYAATNAVGRYSAPIMPYVMVFAAYTLVQLLSKWTKRPVCLQNC
jgi:4-amino-4-deoxy-L-arabinose transferase-like glycosyltransferase